MDTESAGHRQPLLYALNKHRADSVDDCRVNGIIMFGHLRVG